MGTPVTLACEPGERGRRGTDSLGENHFPSSWRGLRLVPGSLGRGRRRLLAAEGQGTVTVAGPLPDGQHLLPGQLRLLHRGRGSRAARQAGDGRRGVALVMGLGRAPKPQKMVTSEAGHRVPFSGCLQALRWVSGPDNCLDGTAPGPFLPCTLTTSHSLVTPASGRLTAHPSPLTLHPSPRPHRRPLHSRSGSAGHITCGCREPAHMCYCMRVEMSHL